MPRRTITLEQFQAELLAQGVSHRHHYALKCPVCGTVQSMALLVKFGMTGSKAETNIGFNCIGRLTKAGPFKRLRKPLDPTKPGCDWSLGGLFTIHDLEVTRDGKVHPMFEIATAEEAQALERSLQADAADG